MKPQTKQKLGERFANDLADALTHLRRPNQKDENMWAETTHETSGKIIYSIYTNQTNTPAAMLSITKTSDGVFAQIFGYDYKTLEACNCLLPEQFYDFDGAELQLADPTILQGKKHYQISREEER